MKKVNVIKNGEIVQAVLFKIDSEMDNWIQMLHDTQSWGKPSYEETIFDKLGNVTDKILHEAEYTVEIEDVTLEVESKKKKEETKKTDRTGRVDKLKAIDWNLVKTIDDQNKILKWLVKEAIKDDE